MEKTINLKQYCKEHNLRLYEPFIDYMVGLADNGYIDESAADLFVKCNELKGRNLNLADAINGILKDAYMDKENCNNPLVNQNLQSPSFYKDKTPMNIALDCLHLGFYKFKQ